MPARRGGHVDPHVPVRLAAVRQDSTEELDHPPLSNEDGTIIAIAANGPIEGSDVPVFDRDDIPAIADFAWSHIEDARK